MRIAHSQIVRKAELSFRVKWTKLGGLGTRGGGCGAVGDLNVDNADVSPL